LVDGAEVSQEDLLTYSKEHIHERAAHPKHLEILDELPKTAVGKIFKPDLRKRAITRVYNAALGDLTAEVGAVSEDKRRGLIAHIAKSGTVTDEDIGKALDAYTIPWKLAD
jgi:histone H3/H4